MDRRPPTVADIEQAIRAYLQTHPLAVDTERGIREWWLRDSHPRCASADVHAAVLRLVAAGAMAERTLPDGQSAYAIPNPNDIQP